jgi:hypothetical protein
MAVQTAASNLGSTFSNITLTLQQQVKSDNSMIAALNSAKPTGYEGMTATLNGQITQDQVIISNIINNMTSISTGLSSGNPNAFCALVSPVGQLP